MLLVDSNVLLSLLVDGTPWHRATRALHDKDDDWRTESHALVEISNVLARFVRLKALSGPKAIALMQEAEQMMRRRVMTADHAEALRLALRYQTSAYDARFLRCATELGIKLVTEDVKLRNAAPSLTQSLNGALAAST